MADEPMGVGERSVSDECNQNSDDELAESVLQNRHPSSVLQTYERRQAQAEGEARLRSRGSGGCLL